MLYLRDDDIPQAVAMGVADLGIVGLNEVAEKKDSASNRRWISGSGTAASRWPWNAVAYTGWIISAARRVATSYPNILARYFAEQGIEAEIHTIEGFRGDRPGGRDVDAIFDIVSSGDAHLERPARSQKPSFIPRRC